MCFIFPYFFNSRIESKGKILHFKEFISAGIIKIKDIAFECRKGFSKGKIHSRNDIRGFSRLFINQNYKRC
jgi:hypothetical protein